MEVKVLQACMFINEPHLTFLPPSHILMVFWAFQILSFKYSYIKNAPVIRVILHQRDFVGDSAHDLCHREASLSRRP